MVVGIEALAELITGKNITEGSTEPVEE